MELGNPSQREASFVYEYTESSDGRVIADCKAQEDIAYSYYQYIYDSDGNLLHTSRYFKASSTEPDDQVDYAYDEEGRLIRETQDNGSYTAYEYDAQGFLVRESFCSEDGTEISWTEYTNDAYGRAIQLSYMQYGDVYDETWTWTIDWDEASRVHVLRAKNDKGTTKFSQVYEYDEKGNLILCEDKLNEVTYHYAPQEEALFE